MQWIGTTYIVRYYYFFVCYFERSNTNNLIVVVLLEPKTSQSLSGYSTTTLWKEYKILTLSVPKYYDTLFLLVITQIASFFILVFFISKTGKFAEKPVKHKFLLLKTKNKKNHATFPKYAFFDLDFRVEKYFLVYCTKKCFFR